MTRYANHSAYEIINQDQTLMETALFAETLHTEIPYHNFGHVLNAVVYASEEIKAYQEHETGTLRINGIYEALLLHDVLVHTPLEKSFISKEHRSAHIAGYILRELGDNQQNIADVQRWILNTNPAYACTDDAGRIVCRSDLGNTADDLPVFVKEFINVYRENQGMKLKSGRPQDIVNPLIAARESVSYIKNYFRQDLTLGVGDWDRTSNGLCSFVSKALANFSRLPTVVKTLPGEVFDLESDTPKGQAVS